MNKPGAHRSPPGREPQASGGEEATARRDSPADALRVAVFPGTFNPPTFAHLAIAEAAVSAAGVRRIDLALSHAPLAKADLVRPTVAERVAVLEAVAATRPWLGIVTTDAQLIVDVAEGYDVIVVGADKWRQIVDPAWYGGDAGARDRAVARLAGRVFVVPRADDRPAGVELLDVHEDHAHVSSTRARNGDTEVMLPEARAAGLWP